MVNRRATAARRGASTTPEEAPGGMGPEAVRVYLLGGFRVRVGERAVGSGGWRLKKAASLVKILALSKDHRLHREQAMDLLWPELDVTAATNNLRQALHVARKTLQPTGASGYLRLRGEQVSLCPDSPLWVDAGAFEQAAATAKRTRDPAANRAAIEL
jgi:DNA-binding SARP family transcriptional activator